jgi:hypothetical protein
LRQEDRIFIGRWRKKHGQLEFKFKTEELLFQQLVKNLREGACVSIMVDFAADDGRLSQIAKLKAGTREIAKESGHTFIEIEQRIKKDSGLYEEIEQIYKSFGNCSVEELSSAIQVMILLGETCGINLH